MKKGSWNISFCDKQFSTYETEEKNFNSNFGISFSKMDQKKFLQSKISFQFPKLNFLNEKIKNILRAVYGDYKSKLKRVELDKLSRRTTLVEWDQYSIASTLIKLYNASDTDIRRTLWEAVYINDRLPGQGKFTNQSRLKINRQSLPYRIRPTFATISFDWVGKTFLATL